MLRSVSVFLVLSAVAFAQCSQYADIAQNYLASGKCYPNCFPAAQEYYSAASCYKNSGDTASAAKYYSLAATYFGEAAGYLVQGGDYRLAGKSYEYAADSYAAVGKDASAAQYYEKARAVFMDKGLLDDLATLDAKLAPEPTKPQLTGITGNVTYSLSPAGILGLIALFFALGSIGYVVYTNKPARPSSQAFERRRPAAEKPATFDIDEIIEEKPRQPAAEAPRQPADRAVAARERAKDKLRKKYVR